MTPVFRTPIESAKRTHTNELPAHAGAGDRFPRGVAVAMVTPFAEDGSLDGEAAAGLARWLVESGVHHLVLCGTTGEAPSLSIGERRELIGLVREAVSDGRPDSGTATDEARSTPRPVFLTAGISAATESGVLENLESLATLADGFLLAPPPYVKPPQWAIEALCRRVADQAPGPVCLYHVPGRTGVGFDVETLTRLGTHPRIAALKYADGDLVKLAAIRRLCGDHLAVFSGEDALYLPMLSLGAVGVISVAAHVVPARMIELTRCHERGDVNRAARLFFEVFPSLQACFALTNPIPVKLWLHRLQMIATPHVRSPLGLPAGEMLERLLARFDDCPEDTDRTDRTGRSGAEEVRAERTPTGAA